MAGAVGIVFGLCVLSFTLGAALMYVLVRRREEASDTPSPDVRAEQSWVDKPSVVEPVASEYDTRPIHRNPVIGLPQLEPALAVLAEQVVPPKPVVARELVAKPVAARKPVVVPQPAVVPELVAEPEPVAEVQPVAEVHPEPVAESEVAEAKTVGAAGYDWDGDLDPPLGEVEAPEPTVAASTDIPDLPPPASPQPAEHTTWVEREDFRQRYLRTFEEARRKAGSN